MATLIADRIKLFLRTSSSSDLSHQSKVGGTIVQRGRHQYVAALDDVSFKLKDGDRLALVGHNGSGKTTLLQVLAGIYKPHSGRVIAEGRVGNVINIGLGFRPEATGRRNIILKSLIEGRTRKQAEEILQDVADFTELGRFLDEPISSYSQGMRMRLAFGVCTAFRHDILLLDEWIGAGDRDFQSKAKKRLEAFADTKIVVLASHNQQLINAFCNKTLRLTKGRVTETNWV